MHVESCAFVIFRRMVPLNYNSIITIYVLIIVVCLYICVCGGIDNNDSDLCGIINVMISWTLITQLDTLFNYIPLF